MWQRNKNTSSYANTSPALGGGGSVGGTSSPGGALGKSVSYVNDNPWSDTNTKPGGQYHPRRLYGRRGHTQGAQNKGFSGGGLSPAGQGGFNKLASGSWLGSGVGGPATPKISGVFTGQGAPGGAYSS